MMERGENVFDVRDREVSELPQFDGATIRCSKKTSEVS
jgi:hypothetical protein